MRSMICRCARPKLVAALGMALAMSLFAGAQTTPTQTTLAVRTSQVAGHTQARASIAVTDQNGVPVHGLVAIEEGSRQLAGVALDGSGQATADVDLSAGDHTLRAVYIGSAAAQSSESRPQAATASSSTTPDFQVTVTSLQPASTLVPGSAGTAIVTLTPVNNAALTAPMFITLSCSGLPDQSSCTFTPATLEILATTPTSCNAGAPASACPPTSSIVIQTQAPGTAARLNNPQHPGPGSSPIALAILFPGVFALGSLAWGTRRRRWLSRALVVAMVGAVTVLGTSACNPQYNYFHHGQPTNPPTPAGNYTVTVTAQSSNGITAISRSTTLAMTVK